MKNNLENEFALTIMLIVFIILGSIYVGYINSKDDELIYNCKHNINCINPITNKHF